MPGASGFKDHFSERAACYARHRPQYPAGLFDYLAGLARRRRLAWDCATGNGQAAIALSRYFDRVIATDASDAQIAAAIRGSGVDYRVAPAEASGLDEHSVDLLAVGQALHWFDAGRFSDEAERVLVPGGILAAWCYELCTVTPDCDAVIDRLYTEIVGDFWPPERRLIEEGYGGIDMPGAAIPAPDFTMSLEWTAPDMLGYLRTWSACHRYRRARGVDPVSLIDEALFAAWGEARRPVVWPLTLRVSRL